METITDEHFDIKVCILDDQPTPEGRYFCAVSFRIRTKSHSYPQTCLMDFLDMDYILDLLEDPKEYAFNGGRVYDPEEGP